MANLHKTVICLLFLLVSFPIPSACVTLLACTSPATTISLTQVSETFKYPSTGSYPLLTTCEWLFQSSVTDYTISFVVSNIYVDCGDILRFHDGTSSSASAIGNAICCSGCTLAYKSTTGNNLYGKLSTDKTLSASESGFQVTINVGKDESHCSTTGTVNDVTLSSADKITLTSPSFPKAYPPNFECTYTYAYSSGTIQIEFLYLDVEPNGSDCYDFVEIYDGSSTSSSVIKRVCGTTLPAVKYTSTGSSVTLKFSSDAFSTNLGYKAIISPVGTEESTTTATIVSSTVETTTYDSCYTNPCGHGGTCHSNYGYPGHYCTCTNGYSGRDCESSTEFSPDGVITVGCNDNQWNVSVYLPPLYSRYPDFITNDVYLGQNSCSGYLDGNYLRFQPNYTTCGTTTNTSTNHIAYSNKIIYAIHDPNHHFIIREYRFRVHVDCITLRNEEGSGHIDPGHDVTLPPSYYVTGFSHHTVHLQFYTDSDFQHPLKGPKAGDAIYVRAFTDVRDYNMKMRLSDCYATPTSNKYSSMNYFIIKNGCKYDPNARIVSQHTYETRFYFQYFEFSENPGAFYLHCNASICKLNDYSPSCEPVCHQKRLTGGDIIFDGPLDALTVNEAVRLASAKGDERGNTNQTGSSTLLLVISLVFGGVFLIMVFSIVAGRLKSSKQRRQEEVKTI